MVSGSVSIMRSSFLVTEWVMIDCVVRWIKSILDILEMMYFCEMDNEEIIVI